MKYSTFKQFLIELDLLPSADDISIRLIYGGWIHPSGKYFSVWDAEHEKTIQGNPEIFGLHSIRVDYAKVFDNGWVRIVWAYGRGSAIEGQAKPIKKVWPKIGPRIIKSKPDYVDIDIIKEGTIKSKDHEFHLPQERKQLVDFIHSL